MRLWNRVRFWFTRGRLDSELAAETRAHRDMIEAQLRGQGLSAADAHAAALRQFGNDLAAREQSRDEWGFAWLDAALRDGRFALRLLRRQPLVTLAAVLTVGLAVGANTAIVSVLETALLNPLGIRDAGKAMVASVRIEKIQMKGAETSAVEYRELQSMTDIFSAVAASEGRWWTAEAGGLPTRMLGRAVTADYFRVFGERPLAGRFFTPEDQESVAVISYGLWQTQFAGAPSAIGQNLMLDGRPYRIVGIAGRGFHVPAGVQAWVPVVFSPQRLHQRGYNMVERVFVRLRDGVTSAQAADRVNRYVAALKTSSSDAAEMAHFGYFIDLDSFAHFIAGDLRRPLWLLWTAALVVLLVGCANVALLLVSRTAGRRREMAIRLAVGATRGQILRQLFVESALLGALSGACGIGVAAVAVSLVTRLAIPGKALLELVTLDRRLMLYGLGIALACSLASGIAPAAQLLLRNQAAAMSRTARRRFQDAFLAAEVAAAVVLLVGTGLLLRSLWAVEQVRPGFDPSHLATGYLLRPANDPSFLDRLDHNLRALPGVESAALAYPIPFTGGGLTSGFSIVHRGHLPGQPEFHGEAYFVSAPYFETLRIPLLRGRALADSDTATAPRVCVVDARFAARFFPDGTPIGEQIGMYGVARIVGVVGSIHGDALDHDSRPTVYYAMPQITFFPSRAIVLRTKLPGGPLIRQVVRQTNASAPVFDVRSMEDRIAESLGIRRIVGILVSVFGALCLLLAMVGLNGVVSEIVGERTVEIGVRLALGARPAQILAHFLGYGLAAGGAGLVLGLAGAGWAQQWLAGLLYDVRPFDLSVFGLAALAVLATLLAAVFWPARRAARIDPQRALRYE
ncbi:MAG: ADOP family duplicated permease [Bryobacteraceae bacterium]